MARAPEPPPKRANGEGSVYWRPARNRYICQAIPPDADRPVYATVPGLTEQTPANDRAAIRWLNKWFPTVMSAARKKKQRRVTVKEYCDQWLARMNRATPNTYRNNSVVIRNHILPAFGTKAMDKVTVDDIRDIYAKAFKRKLKPDSVMTYAKMVNKIFGDAVKDGVISESPAVRAMPIVAPAPPRDYPVIGIEKLEAFRAAIHKTPLETMFVVGLETGMRQSELRGLTWKDVDLDAGVLVNSHKVEQQLDGKYTHGPTKTRQVRAIALSDVAIASLRTQRVKVNTQRLKAGPAWEDHELVWPDEQGGFMKSWRPVRELQRALGKAELPKMRFHDLRHSFATALLEETGNVALVADALGHTTTRVTETIYARVTSRMRQEVAAAMNRRAKLVEARKQAESQAVADSVADTDQQTA